MCLMAIYELPNCQNRLKLNKTAFTSTCALHTIQVRRPRCRLRVYRLHSSEYQEVYMEFIYFDLVC